MLRQLLTLSIALAVALPADNCVTLCAQEAPTAAVSANDSAAEDIEEIDTVEDVETVENVSAVEQGGLFQAIGKFHPVVLHFPIAWMILLVLVELAILTGIAGELNRWSFPLLLLTLISFIPAIVSGLGLGAAHGSEDTDFLHTMMLHRNFNIAAALVLLLAGILRMGLGQSAGNRSKAGYYILVFAAAGLMVFGSHLGGELVWGEGFLPGLF